MKPKGSSFAMTVVLALTLALMSLPSLAQHGGQAGGHEGAIHVGKKGDFTFTTNTRVGDAMLPAGAYQFQHRVEGGEHVFVFKKAQSGKEVARVKCMVEPLGKKAEQTLIYSTKNDAGESAVQQIVVQGENVKHVF